MAMQSSLGSGNPPANAEARNVAADQKAAIKKRIAEYKSAGLSTEHLEFKLTQIVNREKGQRKSAPEPDRADATDGMAKCEAEISEREKSGAPPGKRREGASGFSVPGGVPDQKSEKDAGSPHQTTSVPDQVSPWPAKDPQPAIKSPPQSANAEVERADAEKKAAATKAAAAKSDKK